MGCGVFTLVGARMPGFRMPAGCVDTTAIACCVCCGCQPASAHGAEGAPFNGECGRCVASAVSERVQAQDFKGQNGSCWIKYID